MFKVRLAVDHLHAKWLFTWLSLMMSLIVSYFVLSFLPHDMSFHRSGAALSQFLRIFLPTLLLRNLFLKILQICFNFA